MLNLALIAMSLNFIGLNKKYFSINESQINQQKNKKKIEKKGK